MGKGIPLQPNFSDCGLYLIAYVNQFLKNPGRFVTKSVTRQMREKEDWPNFNAYTLREKCRNLVLGTGKQQNNLPLTAAEQAAIEEQEITHPASQELPVRDASHQDPKPKATQPQGKQRESGKHEDQERLADAYNGDDSGPHRPPTYDGFMRKHVYDVDDDDSVNAKIVNDSRPSTAQTGDGEASGAQGGFLAGITDYAADADNAHQDDDEMLLSDEPATSSPQGPQHVSQFFPPKEGASQVAQEVAEIMKRSPRLAGFAEQQRQKETLQRLKDEMPRGTEEDNEV